MKLAGYYMRLRNRFDHIEDGQDLLTTVDELAEILTCTRRNVLFILKRMEERGWVSWIPSRGRGHRSVLTLLLPAGQLVLEMAQNLVKQKDLRGAFESLNVSAIPADVRNQFNEWLHGYFGYSTEIRDEKKLDILRFPLSQSLLTLDPLYINLSGESHVVNQIFDGLVRHHRVKQTIEPHIAHAWEVDRSRTKWTFYLRKGILFHHGRELTAHDVRFTLERMRHSTAKSLYRWVYDKIASVDASDPTTVHIRLQEPNELFLGFLSTNRASIVPADIVSGSPDSFGQKPVGTGPFQLASNQDSICVLEAFPAYFLGRAHLDRVEIWSLHDPEWNADELQLSRFQIIHNYRMPEEVAAEWNHVQQLGTTCKFITLNTLKPGPLQDRDFREALCRAIDKQAIVEQLAEDAAETTEGFMNRSPSEQPVKPFETSAILKRMSPDANPLQLCTIPQYAHDAGLIQKELQRSGLEVEVKLIEAEQFKGEQRLKADLILFSVMMDNDLELRLIDLFASMSQHLQPGLKSEIGRTMERIWLEPSPAKREQHFTFLERRLRDECAILFLYQRRLQTLFHPSVKGIALDSLGWVRFKDIWFKTEAGES